MVLALHGADVHAMRAMQQFVSAGAWPEETLLKRHWRAVEETLGDAAGVLTRDGSDGLKQGKESVGVTRQTVAKWANGPTVKPGMFGLCQRVGLYLVGSASVASQSWVKRTTVLSAAQHVACPRIFLPDDTRVGLGDAREVVDDQQWRAHWVTCDAAFGRDTAVLDHVAGSGLWDCAAVPHDTRVWLERPLTAVLAWSGRGRKPSRERLGDGPHAAEEVASLAARVHPEQWQRCVRKAGSTGPMVADFWARRVVTGRDALPGPEVWLVLRRHIETGALKTSCAMPRPSPGWKPWPASVACGGPWKPAVRQASNSWAWVIMKCAVGEGGIII